MNFSGAGVNKHPSSMRSCLFFIKYLCSVLLELLNVCFLDIANGKTLEKGRVSREEAGRGLNKKFSKPQPSPVQASAWGSSWTKHILPRYKLSIPTGGIRSAKSTDFGLKTCVSGGE